MFDRTAVLLAAAAAAAVSAPLAAQTPPPSPPGPIASPIPVQTFPQGAEVLSVDGERLGVLSHVEIRPGGERILHIRRPDGPVMTAPAVVASRGERAVVLEWTRAEFEAAAAPPVDAAAAPVPPLM